MTSKGTGVDHTVSPAEGKQILKRDRSPRSEALPRCMTHGTFLYMISGLAPVNLLWGEMGAIATEVDGAV